MKKKIKIKIKKGNLITSIIMGIYLAFATTTPEWPTSVIKIFIIKALVFPVGLYFLLNYIDNLTIKEGNKKATKKDYIRWYLYILCLLLYSLFIYWSKDLLIYDAQDQYNQVVTGVYSDWHPVMHTFLFYRLPTLLYENMMMTCIFQMLFVSVCMLYVCHFLSKMGLSRKTVTLILSIIIFNPTFDIMAIAPIKDTAFSYSMMLMTMFLIEIYLSKGTWLINKKNYLLFWLASFGIMFIRHNGIASLLCIILALLIFYKSIRKQIYYVLGSLLLLRFIIVPGIYLRHGIYKVNVNPSEMTDVMMMQTFHIYTHGNLTEEQKNHMYEYVKKEDIDTLYNPYSFYDVKFNTEFYYTSNKVNSAPIEFLKFWWELVSENPRLAIHSHIYSTSHTWQIKYSQCEDGSLLTYTIFPWGATQTDKVDLANIFIFNKQVLLTFPFNIIFFTVGPGIFLILLSMLYVFSKSKDKLRCLIPYIPSVSNFVLMLIMISGRESRYVYPNLLCAYPLVVFMIIINTQKKKNSVSK